MCVQAVWRCTCVMCVHVCITVYGNAGRLCAPASGRSAGYRPPVVHGVPVMEKDPAYAKVCVSFVALFVMSIVACLRRRAAPRHRQCHTSREGGHNTCVSMFLRNCRDVKACACVRMNTRCENCRTSASLSIHAGLAFVPQTFGGHPNVPILLSACGISDGCGSSTMFVLSTYVQ